MLVLVVSSEMMMVMEVTIKQSIIIFTCRSDGSFINIYTLLIFF